MCVGLSPPSTLITTRPDWRVCTIRTSLIAKSTFLILLVTASVAAAQVSPYEARQESLTREVLQRGRSPGALLPLLELWQLWEDVPRSGALSRLSRIVRSNRLSQENRQIARVLYGEALLRAGDLAGLRNQVEDLGYLRSFFVIGPFDNDGKRGFDEPMPPETITQDGFDPMASWVGKGHMRRWRQVPEGLPMALVDLSELMWPRENVCAYATTSIDVSRDKALTLWLGAGGAIRVWWNGDSVFSDSTYGGAWPDRNAVRVKAKRGKNRLLIKSCVAEGSWGFYARVTERSGVGSMEWFRKRAESPRASTAQLEAFAKYLHYTGSDDPAREEARQFAVKAATKGRSVRRLLFAASLSSERSEALGYVDRAQSLAPKANDVLLAKARLVYSGVQPEEALPMLERMSKRDIAWFDGVLLRAELLQRLQLNETALEELQRAAKRVGEAPRWLRALATAARASGRPDLAIDYEERAVAARYDDRTGRRTLLRDAMQRQEQARIDAHLDALQELAAGDGAALRYVSRVYGGLGLPDQALEMIGRALQIAPDDPNIISDHGRLLLRLGQDEAAASRLALALELRPQDADTRDLLSQIKPRPRQDEAYAVALVKLRARMAPARGYPSTILEDLTVNTVYENGLGSRFRQVAAQIHDDQGARQWQQFSIQYDPNAQRVELRVARVHRADGSVLEATRRFERPVGEPWYRIYYDTRDLVILFPELRTDDLVELQWRVDDVAHRNLFHDYFGDLHPLQGFSPTRRFDYVLLSPESREFFFNEIEVEGIKHVTELRDSKRVDHFYATDIPALEAEEWMPGITEVAPYLHVSTYRTWEDVGRWYWGLIQDQLLIDDSLRTTTREVVRGAKTDREKVERIHGWVLEKTRYVGLEFGIHGYKPYRVPQVVRRGFGDCKDKASLLYAMLKEAGVESHIVLVRTRANGRIADLPASLAVFDHAIAYVPSLDLYLDGTAEHSGIEELPGGDQGVMVLHVYPDGASLRVTPVSTSAQNRLSRELEVVLSADGSADVTAKEEVRGVEAATYRSTYEASGTQVDRLERMMSSVFPGLRVESHRFDSLSDLNRPVRLRYRAHVPQFAARRGSELEMGISVMGGLIRRMAAKPRRQHALDLETTRQYREHRTIKLPPGARSAELPKGGQAKSAFGRLAVRVESTKNTVSVTTELELNKDRISAEEYPAFRAWMRQADQLLRGRIRIGGVR